MRWRRIRPRYTAPVVLALAMGSGHPMIARAGDFSTVFTVDIRAQSLASALTSLADHADLQILFPEDLVRGLQAPAVSGNYSSLQALERLLEGANLELAMSGRDTVVIRARKSSVAQTKAALR